jgi:uncharacterized protein (TIGR03435 family)
MRTVVGIALIFGACCGAYRPAFGQSAPATPAFEVASVKPHPDPPHSMGISTSGGRLTVEASYVSAVIMYAYNLKNYQIDIPKSLASANDAMYDIVAKAQGDGVPTTDELKQMLQSLLADRFKLRVHREMRQMPVYALVIGKNGLKLKASAPDAGNLGRMTISGRNYVVTRPKATVDDVVSAISNAFLERPVLDKTGLTGAYDLKLTYTPNIRSNREGDPDLNDISIFTAVEEQLGLKLEPQKAEIEILVVDHLEKPSEN